SKEKLDVIQKAIYSWNSDQDRKWGGNYKDRYQLLLMVNDDSVNIKPTIDWFLKQEKEKQLQKEEKAKAKAKTKLAREKKLQKKKEQKEIEEFKKLAVKLGHIVKI